MTELRGLMVGRASRASRALLSCPATMPPASPLPRMARIAIIALMLLASVGALAQQGDPSAPAPAPAAPGGSTTPPPAGTDTPATGRHAADTPPADAASPDGAPPSAEAPPAAPAPPPPKRAGDADLRESVCLMIESAARAHNLPLEFFARVIWQESRFQPNVVGPRTRSGDRAQGIAQFMPRTAAERGLFDPFDPVQALPKSAEFLRELADQFGNLGLAAAAYNAGPQRVRDSLSGRRHPAAGAGLALGPPPPAGGDAELRAGHHRDLGRRMGAQRQARAGAAGAA